MLQKGTSLLKFHIFLGALNVVADVLSRFQMQRFRTLVPTANAFPEPVDSNLMELQRSLCQQNEKETHSSINGSSDCSEPTWLLIRDELTQLELEDSYLFA